MFVALVTQNAKRVRRFVFCGLSGCAIFVPHYVIKGKIFGKK